MRKAVAMSVVLAFIGVWIVLAVTIGGWLKDAPRIVQLIYYVAAGVGWAFPLKPLMLWMNSGPASEKNKA